MSNDMPEDPWDTFVDYDMDDPDERVKACYGDMKSLNWNRLQRAGGEVGVYPDKVKETEKSLRQKLAEELVFRGPVGDDTLYIRRNGESIPLRDYE